MSADFWASYLSGALGILIGNRLDVIKVQYQAGLTHHTPTTSAVTATATATLPITTPLPQPQSLPNTRSSNISHITNYFRGSAAPILGYGALNSILFVTFNRSLGVMEPAIFDYTKLAGTDLSKVWLAGAIGGLATFVVSTPTELVKCRTQLQPQLSTSSASSYTVFRHTLRDFGVRGLYTGGVVTAVRDSVGYGWYFWSYELCKRLLVGQRSADPFVDMKAWETLVAGGIAGVITWASVYPLDVIKTRIQTGVGVAMEGTNTRTRTTTDTYSRSNRNNSTGSSNSIGSSTRGDQPQPRVGETDALLAGKERKGTSSFEVAKQIWRDSGLKGFYRGLGICSLRAFIVNGVQWYCYEEIMSLLTRAPSSKTGATV